MSRWATQQNNALEFANWSNCGRHIGDDDNNDNGDDHRSTSWTNDDKAKKEVK